MTGVAAIKGTSELDKSVCIQEVKPTRIGFVKQIHECINESVLKIVHIYLLFLLATLTEFLKILYTNGNF